MRRTALSRREEALFWRAKGRESNRNGYCQRPRQGMPGLLRVCLTGDLMNAQIAARPQPLICSSWSLHPTGTISKHRPVCHIDLYMPQHLWQVALGTHWNASSPWPVIPHESMRIPGYARLKQTVSIYSWVQVPATSSGCAVHTAGTVLTRG